MRRGRGAGLAGLAAVLLVAAGRAQVQQEPSAETNEGTGVTINCSHPNIQSYDYIHWYRQLPGRAPTFLVSSFQGSKDLQAPPGRLSVAADRRSSALWLARPRRGDAAVYYCALKAPRVDGHSVTAEDAANGSGESKKSRQLLCCYYLPLRTESKTVLSQTPSKLNLSPSPMTSSPKIWYKTKPVTADRFTEADRGIPCRGGYYLTSSS
ncbi:uncharacterized protein LOC141933998 [Strix aluco]|uniref:uncharacterized protein LOC141933998 n=1 Tax=Strix aluco TaxID=111821 RepID=UPI003DA51809